MICPVSLERRTASVSTRPSLRNVNSLQLESSKKSLDERNLDRSRRGVNGYIRRVEMLGYRSIDLRPR